MVILGRLNVNRNHSKHLALEHNTQFWWPKISDMLKEQEGPGSLKAWKHTLACKTQDGQTSQTHLLIFYVTAYETHTVNSCSI